MEIVQATFHSYPFTKATSLVSASSWSLRNISQYWVPSALIFWQLVSFEKCIILSCNFVLSSSYTCSIKFKRVVLFSPFFINIENSDGIIISRDFKRYFKPEPRPILSTIFMLLSLYESQARNIVLYYWGMLFNILLAKSLAVPLFRGNTRISVITSRMYVCSVSFPGSCLPPVIIGGLGGDQPYQSWWQVLTNTEWKIHVWSFQNLLLAVLNFILDVNFTDQNFSWK